VNQELSHESALELLPWLVNDTLHGSERERLERHVRDCLVCRAELRSQRALASLIESQPTLDLSVDRGFDALLARIDSRHTRAVLPRRWWTALWRRPAVLIGATVTATVVVAVGVWIGLTDPDLADAGSFTTLTEPRTDTDVLVDVVFAPDVSEVQMRALLQELGLTIVAGPSALGRYTLRDDDAVARNTDPLIARLRDDPRVRLAAPTFIREPSGETP